MNMIKGFVLGFVLVTGLMISLAAQAGWWFHFPSGQTEWDWSDASCWTDDKKNHAVPTSGDCNCDQGGTITITNNVPKTYQFWMRSAPSKPLTLHFFPGVTNGEWSAIVAGLQSGQFGRVQIDAGAQYVGGLVVGQSGSGIVTNCGVIRYNNPVMIGQNSGSVGRLVMMNGGAFSPKYAKDLTVGGLGYGELEIVNANPGWYFYAHNGSGDVLVGESAAKGRIIIQNNSSFTACYVYLGGKTAGRAGTGELVLHGGTYYNNRDNGPEWGNGETLFWLGCCPDSNGGYDANSFGRIRGWGTFDGFDGGRRASRSIRASMVNGEILADGDGDENNRLAIFSGIYSVSNAAPETAGSTTSGWRAVNKGLVTLPMNYGWDGDHYAKNVGYPGCALEKDEEGLSPDLVNAARVIGYMTYPGQPKYIGAAVLAADRTDAHTNSLPIECNVLSVHKFGFFASAAPTRAIRCDKANIAIRYDQTKIRRPDSRLELWRYVDADSKWTRLVRLEPGERPSNKVIAMDSNARVTGNLNETYNLGTFAVVETKPRGLFILVQ